MHVIRENEDIDLINIRQEYNELRKEYHSMEKTNSDELLMFRDQLKEMKLDIEDTEDDIVNDIYAKINAKDIRIHVKLPKNDDKKPIFEAEDRESYFVCKLINRELERVYKIETFSRDSIISDLYQIYDNKKIEPTFKIEVQF